MLPAVIVFVYTLLGIIVMAGARWGGYRPPHWTGWGFVGAVWPIVVVKACKRAGRA